MGLKQPVRARGVPAALVPFGALAGLLTLD